MVYPPSTANACPITKLAPGLQSQTTASATSSARPSRPIGTSLKDENEMARYGEALWRRLYNDETCCDGAHITPYVRFERYICSGIVPIHRFADSGPEFTNDQNRAQRFATSQEGT